jgi:hypothetical protein
MRTHDLKCWPEAFEATLRNMKRFEFRLNDRGYENGDILHLRKWNPKTRRYTGRHCYVMVLYILKSGFGLPNGYCIMSISPPSSKIFPE